MSLSNLIENYRNLNIYSAENSVNEIKDLITMEISAALGLFDNNWEDTNTYNYSRTVHNESVDGKVLVKEVANQEHGIVFGETSTNPAFSGGVIIDNHKLDTFTMATSLSLSTVTSSTTTSSTSPPVTASMETLYNAAINISTSAAPTIAVDQVAANGVINITLNFTNSPTSWMSAGRIQIPLYAVIFLLAVIGNSLVILTLVQNKRMRTITNVFLLNLAISDLFLGVLCMPFTLVGALLRDFIFGEFMCKILPFLQG